MAVVATAAGPYVRAFAKVVQDEGVAAAGMVHVPQHRPQPAVVAVRLHTPPLQLGTQGGGVAARHQGGLVGPLSGNGVAAHEPGAFEHRQHGAGRHRVLEPRHLGPVVRGKGLGALGAAGLHGPPNGLHILLGWVGGIDEELLGAHVGVVEQQHAFGGLAVPPNMNTGPP